MSKKIPPSPSPDQTIPRQEPHESTASELDETFMMEDTKAHLQANPAEIDSDHTFILESDSESHLFNMIHDSDDTAAFAPPTEDTAAFQGGASTSPSIDDTAAFSSKLTALVPPPTPLSQTQDSKYVGSELGRGGMGAVYQVEDSLLERRLAMKVLHDSLMSSTDIAERFIAEAPLTAQLQHPGIVPVHDMGTLPDGRMRHHARSQGAVVPRDYSICSSCRQK